MKNGRDRILLVGLVLALLASSALAAPEVANVDVRGLQVGATTTITIDGSGLLPEPRIVASFPIASQTVQPNAADNRVVIDVTLDGSPQPGMYNLWLANANGVSSRTVVAVDHLPQQPFATEISALPVALHGAVGGSARLRTAFDGKADQEILFEVEAQRLGGKLRPVLHLYDAAGKHLAWSMPSPAQRGDSRLQTTLPADGKYTIELHDLQYAAPAPSHFRLKIGAWQFADQVFPAAVERGKPASLELIGNVPPDQRIPLTAAGLIEQMPVAWLDAAPSSGIRPGISISRFPEAIEAPPTEGLQSFPAVPSAINGRLAEPGEQDRYLLAVKPGDVLRFDLFADRIGSPMDAVLEILNEQGGRLAIGDDMAGSADAQLDYTVPAGVEKIVVAIKDVNGGGGRRCIYRIAVTSANPSANPDFALKLEQDRHSIPQGDRLVVKVTADRRGYDGPIRLSFDDLPAGVQVQGDVIPAGATAALMTLHGAGTRVAQALTAFRGESVGVDPPIIRFAADDQHPIGQIQPWLTNEYAVAIAKPGDVGFGIAVGKLPDGAHLVLGGKLQTPVDCVRPVGFDGPVRLTLVTSQVPPLVNAQPDPNRTLRQETPNVEIPSDPQAVAAYDAKLAAAKALADAEANAKAIAATADADQANADAAAQVKKATDNLAAADKAAVVASALAKNDGALSVIVPSDLPAGDYELAVRAELLSRDKQAVLARSVTQVRRFAVLNPIAVALSGPAQIAAQIDPQSGATVALAGKIERRAGQASDVTVTLSGLPAGIAVPSAVVKPDQTDFTLEVKFPANFQPTTLDGIKLFATGKMEATLPDVRSAEVAITIDLQPPKPESK